MQNLFCLSPRPNHEFYVTYVELKAITSGASWYVSFYCWYNPMTDAQVSWLFTLRHREWTLPLLVLQDCLVPHHQRYSRLQPDIPPGSKSALRAHRLWA